MASSRRPLPSALERARRYGLVRYQDYQDVSAGRADLSAARVAKRVRILRVFVMTGAVFCVAPQLLMIWVFLNDGDVNSFWGALKPTLHAAAFAAGGYLLSRELNATADGLDELAMEGGSAGGPIDAGEGAAPQSAAE